MQTVNSRVAMEIQSHISEDKVSSISDKEMILVNYKKEANKKYKVPEELKTQKLMISGITSDSSVSDESDMSAYESDGDEEWNEYLEYQKDLESFSGMVRILMRKFWVF